MIEGDTDLGLIVRNTLDAVDRPRIKPADLLPHRALPRLAAFLASRS